LEKEQQPFGTAEISSNKEVRIEIQGHKYYVRREELAQLLHGYRKTILLQTQND